MYKVVQTDINIVQFNWKMLYNIKSNITGNIFQNNYTKHCKLGCTMCTTLYNLDKKGCTTSH